SLYSLTITTFTALTALATHLSIKIKIKLCVFIRYTLHFFKHFLWGILVNHPCLLQPITIHKSYQLNILLALKPNHRNHRADNFVYMFLHLEAVLLTQDIGENQIFYKFFLVSSAFVYSRSVVLIY